MTKRTKPAQNEKVVILRNPSIIFHLIPVGLKAPVNAGAITILFEKTITPNLCRLVAICNGGLYLIQVQPAKPGKLLFTRASQDIAVLILKTHNFSPLRLFIPLDDDADRRSLVHLPLNFDHVLPSLRQLLRAKRLQKHTEVRIDNCSWVDF